jgi:class 3 adenylate cyclase
MAGADLVTILFTDLVGSTATLARLGEEAADELRQAHLAILREAIAQAAGREVKNLGDGLMAVFGDTQAAAEPYALMVPYRQSCVVVQTAWLGPVAHELGLLAATLGADAEADAHFAAAEAMQVRIGARATLIHTRLEWGRSLLRRRPGAVDRAIPLLEAALFGARELGLDALEPRIAAVRAEAG